MSSNITSLYFHSCISFHKLFISSVCGSTWDLICYIENFCIANLLKLLAVVALLYVGRYLHTLEIIYYNQMSHFCHHLSSKQCYYSSTLYTRLVSASASAGAHARCCGHVSCHASRPASTHACSCGLSWRTWSRWRKSVWGGWKKIMARLRAMMTWRRVYCMLAHCDLFRKGQENGEGCTWRGP